MSAAVALDPLDLAALLCSRVCHDLISPTGAIVNGLEVLEEKESDEETKTFALDLIKKSAQTASARLQFCRLAFGAAGSAGAQIDLGDAQTMGRASSRMARSSSPGTCRACFCRKTGSNCCLNMLIIAGQTIPRGGTLTVDPIGEGDEHGLPHRRGRAQCPHPAGRAGPARRHVRKRIGRCARDSAVLRRSARPRLRLKVDLEAEGDAIIVATH